LSQKIPRGDVLAKVADVRTIKIVNANHKIGDVTTVILYTVTVSFTERHVNVKEIKKDLHLHI